MKNTRKTFFIISIEDSRANSLIFGVSLKGC